MELTPQELLFGIGNARQQGLNDTAVDILRRLMAETAQSPEVLGEAWEQALEHAMALADEDMAMEIARRLMVLFPNNARYVMVLAERLSRVGRSREALELMNLLKPRTADNPALNYFAGVYAGHVGELDAAKKEFRAAVTKKPDFGDAWSLLASSGGAKSTDIPALEALIESGADHAMPGAAYALGAIYHAEGSHAAAWANWEKANQFERTRRPFNREGELAAMRAIREADARIWQGGDLLMPKPPRAIFIVGAPRSGTSLTEQIIGAASEVGMMGETMLSRLATWPLGNLMAADLEKVGAFTAPGTTWERFGAVYRHMASLRTGDSRVTTDKGAILHLFVGALARMLPNAKFVWVRRDHRDIALSGYRSYLTDGNRWRHDLEDAAAYLQGHDEMMTYWAETFPGQVYELRYEDLVTTPQSETRKLMTFLDLSSVDVSEISFGGSNVPTASFAQIRSKISPRSVDAWKPYGDYLLPAFGQA